MLAIKRLVSHSFLSGFHWASRLCGLSLCVGLPLSAQAIETVSASSGETVTIEADALFDLPPEVRIETNLGEIPIELTPDAAPGTVANFLRYVDGGLYTNSFIHRSAALQDGTPFVIQGGGFFFDTSGEQVAVAPLPTFDPISNEPNVSNTRGTVAMAKLGGDPDSATSQWFVNLSDNGSILDEQNGGFTVFARVVGDGMQTVDAIAALQSFNATQRLGSPFGELPLSDSSLDVANFVTLSSVRRAFPGITAASFPDGGVDYIKVRYGDGVLFLDVLPETPPGTYRLQVEGTALGGSSEVAERDLVITAPEMPWYAGADELEDGWRYFDWFKAFKPEGENWIFHGRHGWLYVKAEATDRMFLWDGALGRWLFTNEDVYPWMYVYGPDEGWVFFFEGGRSGSRFFQRGDTGQIISEADLGP